MSTSTTAPPPAVHHYEEDHSRGGQILGWLKQQYALYILVALLIVATITRGTIFWGGTNLTNLLLQMSIIGVVTLAELIVVLTGGIDISVGSALGLAAVIAAGLFGGPSVFLGLVVAVWLATRLSPAPASVGSAWRDVLLVSLLQGAIGYVQYLTDLPEVLVLAHMLGAALLVVALTRAVLALRTIAQE